MVSHDSTGQADPADPAGCGFPKETLAAGDLMTPVHSTISVIVTSMLSMSSLLSEENTFFTTIWI